MKTNGAKIGGVDMLDGLHGSCFMRKNEQAMIINHEVISVDAAYKRGLITYEGFTHENGITTYYGIRPTKEDVIWKTL